MNICKCAQEICLTAGVHLNKLGTNREQNGNKLPKNTREIGRSTHQYRLAFPEGTVLHPQLFVHNTTAKSVDVTLRFAWRSASAKGKAASPSFRLGGFETHQVDVAALQASEVFPKDAAWTSVILTTNGLPEEVVALAASYDKTLRYGAQTPLTNALDRRRGAVFPNDAALVVSLNLCVGPSAVCRLVAALRVDSV